MAITPSGRFAARMAWRETRGARRHFAYFLACVTVGVTAIVGVQTFSDGLSRAVARSAKALLGADVEIRSSRPLSAEATAMVAGLAREGVRATRARELAAMAQTGAGDRLRTLLVELKAVERGYPFYGRLVTAPDRPLDTLVGHGRALVHPSLLTRLGLAPGDRISVGDLDLVITGTIAQEPDRSLGIFSLGPRVLIAAEDLDRTGLVRPGSRVRYRTLLALPERRAAEPLRDALAAGLPDAGARVVTYAEAQPGFRRFWQQLTMYLGLTGLVALMVGGIGVAVSVRAFVREKLATIAVLKCLGARWREVFGIYLAQSALLGLGGSVAGAIVGSAVPSLLGPLLARLLPFPIEIAPSPRALLGGLAVGVGATLLFSLWPLLEIRRVPPALVLRRDVEPALVGRRPWPAALVIVAGLVGLALWQAGSWRIGAVFVGGLAAALVLLVASARVVVLLSRLGRRGPLAWRQAVANLHRPLSQAGPVLISLGLAVMLIVAVTLLEGSLRRELEYRTDGAAPAFFFLDIQADQADSFVRLVTARGADGAPELTPVVRSRLAAIDGAPVAPETRRRRDDVWHLTREYVLTWGSAPPRHNDVVAGRWWTPEEAARGPLVSVEEEIARLLGVGLGSTLTFDVQGVPVTGRVANLRRVDWQSLDSNFFVIFSPGALDGAPVTYIATARVPPAREDGVQTAVVRAFPNVTAIPVREVLDRVTSVLDQIGLAVRLIAGLSVLTGLVVMAGALSITRRQRLYESVILKVLGATRGFVARLFALEYALLGAGAGLAGTALAAVLAWALLRFTVEIPPRWTPAAFVAGVTGAIALAVAVGFLGTRRLLNQKPLTILRNE